MNKKCQVFTPANYVNELLNNVNYSKNLYGKKILENSCGDGNILFAIVQRYIDDCKKQGYSITKIRNGLTRDIHGIEIDPIQYEKCIKRLNELAEINGIKSVTWDITNEDYLKKNDKAKYQYIIGNPPYITYQEMEEENQKYLKKNFISCKKGKFDYCYAFIEKSINSLDVNGRMAYVVPSSIFKTVYGDTLRNIMMPYMLKIIDYTYEKIFDNALVKSSIVVLHANNQKGILHYIDRSNNKNLFLATNSFGNKWFFTEKSNDGNRRFGDYFKVSHAVATLLNKAFVLKEGTYKECNNFYICNGHRIEKKIVKDTASPRSLRYNKKEKIIFPYYYIKGQVNRYKEEEFVKFFPGANSYLSDYLKQLNDRKSDENTKWYEYGRSQALAGLNTDKLLISTVITSEVAVYLLPPDYIPYAGMYITAKNTVVTINEAIKILQEKKFMQYVMEVGIPISGSSFRITSKDIEDYRF